MLKSCKNQDLKKSRFLAIFDIKLISEIYYTYFDNYHVTVKLNNVVQSRDNCH